MKAESTIKKEIQELGEMRISGTLTDLGIRCCWEAECALAWAIEKDRRIKSSMWIKDHHTIGK